MAIQTNFPAVKPALLLDFANTKRLDPRITFTRTTTATYYDGVTTAKAEENLFLYSQEFDNAAWLTLRATVSANSTTAPDGTATADSLTQQTGQTTSGAVYPLSNINYIASTYIFSVFAKPNGKNFIRLAMVDGGSVFRECYFNVNSGTVGTANNGAVGTITASANGYYRCSISYTFASASSMSARIFLADVDNSSTVVDSGGVYLWGAQLEQRSSVTAYTATTTQAITKYIPVLQTASAGQARFDHNPVTRESLGLLGEEARTNLLTYSEQFDNAVWGKTAGSVSQTNIGIAPDGKTTADEVTTTGGGVFRASIAVANAAAYTATVFVKTISGGGSFVFGFDANPSSGRTSFYLANGTINFNEANVTSSSITDVGNGWYRCSVTATTTSTSCNLVYYNSTSGAKYFLWGAQLEAGAFATSYIPTVASSATRNADVADITDSNFTSWYNQGEGTVYVELASRSPLTGTQSVALNKYPTPWRIQAGTTGNYIFWYGIVAEFYIGGSSGYNNIGTVPTGANKFALGFSSTAGQAASSLNGSTAVSRTGALTGTATRFEIGVQLNGTISKIAYYRKRLTNSQLQNLTS